MSGTSSNTRVLTICGFSAESFRLSPPTLYPFDEPSSSVRNSKLLRAVLKISSVNDDPLEFRSEDFDLEGAP